MITPSQNIRKQTAYHEAGHATIGRVLTLKCGQATIKPNPEEEAAGHAITFDPYACIFEWEKRGKVRYSKNVVWHARIITLMAGAESQAVLLGETLIEGDGDDRFQIALMLEEAVFEDQRERLEARLRKFTRALVRRHAVRIERVAEALLKSTILTGEELDKIVGRSVDDVKVNAPFLLAMYLEDQHRQAARD